ncbi:MAG: hypothetical protein JXA69_12440 [Phycisphaerae bacterium]|nr:hypothetical protein [Phycisphaerae bacterium]
MAQRKRSKWKILLLLLSCALMGWLTLLAFQPTLRKAQLEAACSGADRVIVTTNVLPHYLRTVEDAKRLPSVEVVGSDKAQSLLDCIMLKRTVPSRTCMCYGSMVFCFCRGSEPLAAVSYHHGQSLRWRDGRWFGDADLTEVSQQALGAWLEANARLLDEAAAATALRTTATQPADEPNRPALR